MVEGVSVPSSICMVLGVLGAIICRFLTFVFAVSESFWYQKLMQALVPRVIENHSKVSLEGSTNHRSVSGSWENSIS